MIESEDRKIRRGKKYTGARWKGGGGEKSAVGGCKQLDDQSD